MLQKVLHPVRLMANIRVHPKTEILWYRRVIPARLRPHVPPVEGFALKPDRTEFTKTLGTRSKAEANRKAAALDRLVDEALRDAERRLAASNGYTGAVADLGTTTVHPMIAPNEAFAALERWRCAEIAAAERRLFNREPEVRRTDADLARTRLVMALRDRPMRHRKGWLKIEGFDSKLASALTSHGVPATSDHPALMHLRDEFAAAWEEVIAAEEKMRSGLWAWTIDQSPPLSSPASTTPNQPSGSAARSMTIKQLFDDYLREARTREVAPKTEADAKRIFGRFMEFVGDNADARSVDDTAVIEFRDLLLQLPSRLKQGEASLPIRKLASLYADGHESPRRDIKTVSKWLNFLNAAFVHGVKRKVVRENPVPAATLRRSKRGRASRREPFSSDDLHRIFTSPLFVGCAGIAREHQPGSIIFWGAKYWVALIAATTGARINEIGQMHITDVQFGPEIAIPHLRIAPGSDEPEAAKKTVKTEASKRDMPIHPRLRAHPERN